MTNGDGGQFVFEGSAEDFDHTAIFNGTSNISIDSTGSSVTMGVGGTADVFSMASTGVLTTTGNVEPLGVKTDNYYYANGQSIVFGTSAAGSNTQVQFNNNGDFGAEAAFTYDQSTNTLSADNVAGTLATASQPNITSLGTLSALGVNGTVTAVAFTANTGVFTGDAGGLSNVVAANISGTVATATTAGTVTTAAQPNITSTGTLTSLTVSGNSTSGNVIASSGTMQYGTNPGSGVISVNTGTTTAGIFATTITDINLGLAGQHYYGSNW